MYALNGKETPFSRTALWTWMGGKSVFCLLFLKPKALTQLFWTNQFSASGGELEWWGWQDSFGKVELVPSNLRKQILNIFEKCAGLLVRKCGLCLYSPTALEQSLFPAVEETRGVGVGVAPHTYLSGTYASGTGGLICVVYFDSDSANVC